MHLGKEREKESIVSVGLIDFYCQAKIGFCNTGLPGRRYGWNLWGLLQGLVVKVKEIIVKLIYSYYLVCGHIWR